MDKNSLSGQENKMDKNKIIQLLKQNYDEFLNYMRTLNSADLLYSSQQKWTAGQQLNHIVLCIKPLLQVFSMPKVMIAQNFGQATQAGVSYEALLQQYQTKLTEGGKAPNRFLPESVTLNQCAPLCDKLSVLMTTLYEKIDDFSEQELDHYQIPHPLLGMLTMREMLYNTIYHVQHHQQQAEHYLKTRKKA